MERLLDMHQTITETTIENMECILKIYSEHQSFREHKSGQLQPIVSYITNSLGNKKSRYQGLLHLQAFLPQCPSDILAESGPTWIVLCIKACHNDEFPERNLSFLALAPLLKSMSSVPELHKMVSNNNIGKLLECITSDEMPLSTLYCLEACLKAYPGPCGHFKQNIERFLLDCLTAEDLRKVKMSAKCFHLLQQVSGSGVRGVNHKAAWEHQFGMVIGSLHTILDMLYCNVMEAFMKPENSVILNLPPLDLPDNPVSRNFELSRRFSNLSYFLQAMLSEPFPVPKRVKPDLVLQLITRGLGVTCKSLGRVSTDNLVLGAFLPSLHISLLQILDSLIFCLGRNILCHGQVICNVINQILKWTKSEKYEAGTKPYRSVRSAAYESLIKWLKIANLGSCVELFADEMIAAILSDITPQKLQVKLAVREQNNKHSKKDLLNSNYAGGRSDLNLDNGNEPLGCAALRCLQSMLTAAGSLLKTSTHKNLQILVADLLLDLQRGQISQSLYNNDDCRIELYNVFMKLVLNPCSSFPPPTHLAIMIFSKGQLDKNSEIKKLCTNCLCSIKQIVYTRAFINGNDNEEFIKQTETVPLNGNLLETIETTDYTMETEIKAIEKNMDVEQSEIPGSQESQKTIILDGKLEYDQKQVVNGLEIIPEDQSGNQDLCSDNNPEMNGTEMEVAEILPCPDEIPAKKLKLSENLENEVSLIEEPSKIIDTNKSVEIEIITNNHNNADKTEVPAVNIDTNPEISQINENLENKEPNEVVVLEENSELKKSISDSCKLTYEEMLTSFVSETNEV